MKGDRGATRARASASAPAAASTAAAPARANPIDISVLTVTFGRWSALSQKLASLARQTLDPARFELILCVNDDPASWRALQEVRTPYHLTAFPLTPRRGAAVARNACAARARGDLLYLSDDDAVLEPDTLERHVSAHRGRQRPALVVGGIDFVDGAKTTRQRPERVRYWNANGVNTSLPRAAFERVGGFPEWLGGYGFEDVVLGYELNRAGLATVALPEAVVRHLGPDPMRGADLDKARQAGRSAMVVARRLPELAYRVGAHPLLLAVKRVLLASPLRALWGGAAAYEAAFLEGALEARTNGAEVADVAAGAEGSDDER